MHQDNRTCPNQDGTGVYCRETALNDDILVQPHEFYGARYFFSSRSLAPAGECICDALRSESRRKTGPGASLQVFRRRQIV